ncbi:FAD-dependent oxidoreductase [Kocuria sp. TGY1127_2]|uniref:FAD-dependent oxidoreductase n=1 Tax=Kocuria sp. TGY1127_2 TaxID=2711328 RepID=UPI0015BFB28F|nr:FAD-dependent oxidoreductase [Kocuria sp. TGY1127_2]
MVESPNQEIKAAIQQPRIVIVGSGPSGCYTAQFLRKKWREAEIDMLDRLNSPYGLIRYGVAPDHLGTKAISHQFERLFTKERVGFQGSVEVGRDISLEELTVEYDVVVLATGLWADRKIDGFHRADGAPSHEGVYGAGTITRMINGHPERRTDDVRLGRHVVVVGNGNVAVDLVRLLITPPVRLAQLGVPTDVITALDVEKITSIDVVGRSAVSRAKFDTTMIRELGKMPDVGFGCDLSNFSSADEETAGEKTEAIADLIKGSPSSASRHVNLHFGWTPDHLEGENRVSEAVFRRTAGTPERLSLEADSVCTAVGFTEIADDVLSRRTLETAASDISRGKLADGIYCVGWYRRGPIGTIPDNRADARMVVDSIVEDQERSNAQSINNTTAING